MSDETKDVKDSKAERQNERARAYRIRKRLKESPEDVTQEEKDWFAGYEKTKTPRANQWGPATVEAGDSSDDDNHEVVPDGDDGTVNVPPPRPPHIVIEAKEDDADRGKRTGKQGDDWRDKYRRSGADGREETCAFIASQITGVLQGMENELALAQKAPLVKCEILFPAWVLTLDKWLPKNVKVEPMHVAVIGSAAMTVQRFVHRQAINEAREAKQAEDTVHGWNPAARPPDPPATPAQEPTPAKATEPVETKPETTPAVPTPSPPIINIGAQATIDDRLPPGSVY